MNVWVVSRTFSIKAYIKYLLHARHRKGFGIHSPYVFALLNDVVFDTTPYYSYSDIERTRHLMLHDRTALRTYPIGTSSRTSTTVAREARLSTKPAKYAQLIHRLALHNHSRTIIELGSNLGITTLYLAATDSRATIHTIEEQETIARIAQDNYDRHHASNIHLIHGDIDSHLAPLIASLHTIDLAYIDANHRYTPTMQYYQTIRQKTTPESIIIIDDPHRSPEMEQAWQQITADPTVTLSIDLYHIGLLFLRPELPKQHYIVKY